MKDKFKFEVLQGGLQDGLTARESIHLDRLMEKYFANICFTDDQKEKLKNILKPIMRFYEK